MRLLLSSPQNATGGELGANAQNSNAPNEVFSVTSKMISINNGDNHDCLGSFDFSWFNDFFVRLI